jgi:predicted O-methyltransferase YrrM
MKRLANILALAGLSLGTLTVVLDYLMAGMLMDDAKSPAIAFRLTVAVALSCTLMVGATVAAFLADSNPKRRAVFFLLAASFVGLFLATGGGGFFAKSLTGGDEPARASALPSPNPKYRFTSDWVTRNETLWRKHLGHLQAKSVRALEIGSFEGRATIWLLENILTHPDSRIMTIDPFFEEYGASQNYEERFDRNVEASGLRHKVEKIKGYSHTELRRLQPESYDFAYIDGSHASTDVLLDIALAWDLMKPGGIIIFDDYDRSFLVNGKLKADLTPRMGIDAFLSVFHRRVDVLAREYQLVIRKRETARLPSMDAVEATIHRIASLLS